MEQTSLHTNQRKGVAKTGSQKAKPQAKSGEGLEFKSIFVAPGQDPYGMVTWEKRKSKISGSDGGSVFAMDDVMVPSTWSQLATDIAVSKYFRKAGVPGTGSEKSVKQLVHRVAHTIRQAGEAFGGYFKTSEDAQQFENELAYMLITQRGAFNSPVWFNCGLYHQYGIEGSGGNYRWDADLNQVVETHNAYQFPQCSACFIQSVSDDLMSIFDLCKSEARIFKYGSGTGTNFSKIRGHQEKLSGGGFSSGLMSFLEVLDRGAGATKSGGTTRRAAKMVCLDIDHPEIEEFINWKVREEKKVQALVDAGYPSDFNGEAYRTVAGQNSNNSVRLSDEFMQAVIEDKEWSTKFRTNGEVCKTYRARDLWKQICEAAWKCADPGVQFDTTINNWHTAAGTDRIYGSNPCSEYMFLDDTACNLASINLVKFMDENGNFDVAKYEHACRVFFTAQEILVDMSSYPTKKIAQNSHDYRPLGLGYANLGTMLMIKGIPYDSPEALAWTGSLTAIMHGAAFKASSEMAREKGPFPAYAKNRNSMMKVIRQHREAAYKIDERFAPMELVKAARNRWDDVVEMGEHYGFRNAQATVLAPTGTIGLLMDCDTTGIEPDFALVKFKKLAGGGYFKIINQSVPMALKNLGYAQSEIDAIVRFALGTNSLDGAPHINRQALMAKGLNLEDIGKIERALPGAFDLNSAIAPWVIGDEAVKRLGLDAQKLKQPGNSILKELGFNSEQLVEAGYVICGRMTVEGAPYLKPEHLAVFDCANKCGPLGKRFIAPMAHIRMMGAAQPFLSGAISKTVNLPNESTVAEIDEVYTEGWKLGLKAIAVYRDGCKISQPLNSSGGKADAHGDSVPKAEVDKLVAQAVDQALKKAQATLGAGRRRKMPKKRHGFTVEAKVGGHQVYLRTGEYDDGTLGEIFIDMHKEGATFRSLLNCFAISTSLGLQYGVPLEEFVEKMTFTRFEPQGIVDHPNIKQATSIIDYIFRVLGMEYLGQTDFVHVPPSDIDLAINRNGSKMPVQMDMSLQMAREEATQVATQVAGQLEAKMTTTTKTSASVLSAHLQTMMGDAPFCSSCGHTTVRNGACYKCLNCGNSMGCS
ncbi:MAG: vitamin B12-dependent ribonucleotide reductase [Oligoflexia bacterium]|nr:vitamin B12-dependent ribonucleotide reductase [Oligoflexia bacterium]